MPRSWSTHSARVLRTLDPRLQRVVQRTLDEVTDIKLVCGHRDEIAQNKAYLDGASKLLWPFGKHNKFPSVAVDFQPYPYPEQEEKLWGALGYIAGRMIAIGKEEGVTLRWGGDWDMDGDLTDQKFDDLFHIEIKE